jgi:SAM-dependent methyltransferase
VADIERADPEGTDRQTEDLGPVDSAVPVSEISFHEKAKRSSSFGHVASDYERYRPGPPPAAVDWILSSGRPERIVDLGAGTGALSRLLLERADEVIAIEPDDRMRAVLVEEVPLARAVAARGESMPLPESHVQAIIAATSWHWMDPIPTLLEAGRVLVPGGVLGAIWIGPDPEGAFLTQASSVLAGGYGLENTRLNGQDDVGQGRTESELAKVMIREADRPDPILEIPQGVPFDPPEHEIFRWVIALTADDLIGLLGTFSWIITLPDETRNRLKTEARRLLTEVRGMEGDATVDVAYRSDAWRARRHT